MVFRSLRPTVIVCCCSVLSLLSLLLFVIPLVAAVQLVEATTTTATASAGVVGGRTGSIRLPIILILFVGMIVTMMSHQTYHSGNFLVVNAYNVNRRTMMIGRCRGHHHHHFGHLSSRFATNQLITQFHQQYNEGILTTTRRRSFTTTTVGGRSSSLLSAAVARGRNMNDHPHHRSIRSLSSQVPTRTRSLSSSLNLRLDMTKSSTILNDDVDTHYVPPNHNDTSTATSTVVQNSEPSTSQSMDHLQRQPQAAKEEQQPQERLMHPDDFLDEHGRIPYPKHLSPSSAMAFRDCPQSFLLQYIYKLSQPTNLALAKGSMCHTALEHIFDLDPPDRTLTNLQNMLRSTWSTHRLQDTYRHLFELPSPSELPGVGEGGANDTTSSTNTTTVEDADSPHPPRDVEAEREWGQSALRLLENYYRSEDPRTVIRPNPYRREVWVHSNLTVDPTQGMTSSSSSSSSSSSPKDLFKVRGIVDRLDMVKDSGRKVSLRIVDYKTGKAPTLKYSNDMNRQIYQKNFFQLKIYALLMREKAANAAAARTRSTTSSPITNAEGGGGSIDDHQHNGTASNGSGSTTAAWTAGNGFDVRYLKLYYLDSEEGRAKPWEMDLGETQKERDEVLNEVHQELAQIWTDIINLIDQQDPKAFHHCDRPFCSCHTFRPQFQSGTLWTDNKTTPSSDRHQQLPNSSTTSSNTMPIVPELFGDMN